MTNNTNQPPQFDWNWQPTQDAPDIGNPQYDMPSIPDLQQQCQGSSQGDAQ